MVNARLSIAWGCSKDRLILLINIQWAQGDLVSSVLAVAETGDSFTARFQTTGHFQNIRIPYKAFRPTEETVGEAAQSLDPRLIKSLSLRVDLKGQPQVKKSRKPTQKDLSSLSDSTQGAFKLELNRIHVSNCWLYSTGLQHAKPANPFW